MANKDSLWKLLIITCGGLILSHQSEKEMFHFVCIFTLCVYKTQPQDFARITNSVFLPFFVELLSGKITLSHWSFDNGFISTVHSLIGPHSSQCTFLLRKSTEREALRLRWLVKWMNTITPRTRPPLGPIYLKINFLFIALERRYGLLVVFRVECLRVVHMAALIHVSNWFGTSGKVVKPHRRWAKVVVLILECGCQRGREARIRYSCSPWHTSVCACFGPMWGHAYGTLNMYRVP